MGSPGRLRSAVVAAIVCACVTAVRAERLPFKRYTIADGLPGDRARCIVPDHRGFLWFCTQTGLSRFDGQRFVTYTSDDGLPWSSTNHVLVTRSGELWVATNGGGVARFATGATSGRTDCRRACRFIAFPVGSKPQTSRVNSLHEDPGGRLWAGTDGGLFVLDRPRGSSAFHQVPLRVPSYSDDEVQVWAFAEAGGDALWIGTSRGLIRRAGDGRTTRYHIDPIDGLDHVWSLARDARGQMFIGHDRRVVVASPSATERDPRGFLIGAAIYTSIDGVPVRDVRTLVGDAGGRVWLGTDAGLAAFDGARFHRFTIDEEFGREPVRQLAADAGNLWVATAASGVVRLASNGFVSYGASDGLQLPAAAIVETARGEFCVVAQNGIINTFDGNRFAAIRPHAAAATTASQSTGSGVPLLTRGGEWWIPIGITLYRFSPVERIRDLNRASPLAVYGVRDGLAAASPIFRMFEDSVGDIWISTRQPTQEGLIRWEHATGRFRHHGQADGWMPGYTATAMTETPPGVLWIGLWEGGVVRVRDGRVTVPFWSQRVPRGSIQALYVDRRGGLWIGSDQGGAARIDQPGADDPHIATYSSASGLSSTSVVSITEDAAGRMYFGTTHGVDRLDTATGRVRHFTIADGLAPGEVLSGYGARNGALWFGTWKGVSRLEPQAAPPLRAPIARIDAVYVMGARQAGSDWGDEAVAFELGPAQNQMRIDFFGLPFSQGDGLRYQYRLAGADPDWSPPGPERSVTYARLASGSYRFLVRAVNADGVASDPSASVSFQILPPIWARAWFILLSASAALMTLVALYRYRLARALELERIRTRIATDLHDDIGASLSQIAILSEVARQRAGTAAGAIGEPLASIAGTSRELIDSMSDIVWAINPKRDSVADLVQRMRLFASDMLAARGLEFTFDTHGREDAAKRLDPELRRHVLLVFKEAIANIIRHAACERVAIDLYVGPDDLRLTIADNGHGFDPTVSYDGHGLVNMRRRARQIGAVLEVRAQPGAGAAVMLSVPVQRRAFGARASAQS